MDSNQSILQRVNPISDTGKMTIFQLAGIGDQDFISITKKLNLTYEKTQGSTSIKPIPEEKILSQIIMEVRYRTIEALFEKTGYNTIIDLPCGFTPRGLSISSKGKKYIGLDLPQTIEEFNPVIQSLIEENKDKYSNLHYYGVDATNLTSLEKALEGINEPICITTEGLLMYFTQSEISTLCDNIYHILKRHGGCWITADPEASLQYIMTAQPLFKERFMEIMAKSKKRTEEKADVEVGVNPLIIKAGDKFAENIKNAMIFLSSHGLKAERLNIGDYMPEISTLSNIKKEEAEAIKQKMNNCAYWKITILENNKIPDINKEIKEDKFDISSELKEEKLILKVTGRIDTLTAPQMLSLYEKIKSENKIKSVLIDCEHLNYVSSAGLRVFKIMKNDLEEGVEISNVNKTILDIIKQSKFDEILKIIN